MEGDELDDKEGREIEGVRGGLFGGWMGCVFLLFEAIGMYGFSNSIYVN